MEEITKEIEVTRWREQSYKEKVKKIFYKTSDGQEFEYQSAALHHENWLIDNKKLKPCMRCGSKEVATDIVDTEYGDDEHYVYCDDCSIRTTSIYSTRQEAIDDWNNRPLQEYSTDPCNTPDTQYSTEIHGNEITLHIELPFDINLNKEQAEDIENEFHEAVGEVVYQRFFKHKKKDNG